MATTKHTIPAGYNFAGEMEQAGGFFAWLTDNGINPANISPTYDVVISSNKTTKGISWSVTAYNSGGQPGTWPLMKLPTITVVKYLEQFAPKPVDVSEIKETMQRLKDARKRENDAKAEAEELRAEVLGYLASRGATVGLLDGKPFIEDKLIPTKGRFDRKGFEREYPEIAERFTGEDYDQHRVEFL